jgi:hypothetical protein
VIWYNWDLNPESFDPGPNVPTIRPQISIEPNTVHTSIIFICRRVGYKHVWSPLPVDLLSMKYCQVDHVLCLFAGMLDMCRLHAENVRVFASYLYGQPF